LKESEQKIFPWHYPVTLEEGAFTGFQKDSHLYNVVVAKSQFPGRFNELILDPKKSSKLILGQADMQCVFGRPLIMLGSGRSLFYKNHYLKGVGITGLVNNWAQSGDPYHGSGHLLASSGMREFLISEYIRSMDMEHLIVPCTDILLEKSCNNRKYLSQRTYARAKSGHAPNVDLSLSALTVKEGGFCRYSNILWYLAHQAEDNFLAVDFLLRTFATVENPNLTDKELSSLTIDDSLGSLKKILDRGFYNLVESGLNGIRWGSINNNFSLDGRFLDLELPLVFDGPIFGKVLTKKYIDANPIAFECFHYTSQMRKFIVYLRNFLETFIEIQRWSKSDRSKRQVKALQYFLNSLETEVVKKSIIFDNTRMITLIHSCMKEYSDCSADLKKDLKKMISNDLNLYLTGDYAGKAYEAHIKKLAMKVELGVPTYLLTPKGLHPRLINKGSSKEFTEMIETFENTSTVSEGLKVLKSIHSTLRGQNKKGIRLSDHPQFLKI
jgi:hypothetical protein